jgi:hypothetical protein
MRCSNCGLEAEKDDRYCTRCGEALDEIESLIEQQNTIKAKELTKSKLEQRTLLVGIFFFLLAIIPFYKALTIIAAIAGVGITAIGFYLKHKQEGLRPWAVISLGLAVLLISVGMFLFYEFILMI